MNRYSVPVKSLTLISKKDVYPGTANSPTVVTKYKCLCGEGKIIEENTVGFGDHFVSLECKNCLKKYSSYVRIMGNNFEFFISD